MSDLTYRTIIKLFSAHKYFKIVLETYLSDYFDKPKNSFNIYLSPS